MPLSVPETPTNSRTRNHKPENILKRTIIALALIAGAHQAHAQGVESCTYDQTQAIESARTEGRRLLDRAIGDIEQVPAGQMQDMPRWHYWLGPQEAEARSRQFLRSLIAVRRDILSTRMTCDCSIGPGYYGFAPYTGQNAGKIEICSGFWGRPLSGINSQAGILVHEVSHLRSGARTDDHVYGFQTVSALGVRDPWTAINNADTFQRFVENIPELAMYEGPAIPNPVPAEPEPAPQPSEPAPRPVDPAETDPTAPGASPAPAPETPPSAEAPTEPEAPVAPAPGSAGSDTSTATPEPAPRPVAPSDPEPPAPVDPAPASPEPDPASQPTETPPPGQGSPTPPEGEQASPTSPDASPEPEAAQPRPEPGIPASPEPASPTPLPTPPEEPTPPTGEAEAPGGLEHTDSQDDQPEPENPFAVVGDDPARPQVPSQSSSGGAAWWLLAIVGVGAIVRRR